MIRRIALFLLLAAATPLSAQPYHLYVLGVAQDGGYPHVGCRKACCARYWSGEAPERTPVCLGLFDSLTQKMWMFEATPGYTRQWAHFAEQCGAPDKPTPDGIFLTHAHMGHYTGLMYLGREALGASGARVYAMPGMAAFLSENGPWSQLVRLQNIQIEVLSADSAVALSETIRVIPFRVPHRDEYSETVGYLIHAGSKSVAFIPDIDKWEKWDRDVLELIRRVDYAFLDATFYKNGELQRDMREIPHPFVEESMQVFDALRTEERSKVMFIHFNHTNPLLWDEQALGEVEARGYRVALEGMVLRWDGARR